MKHPVEVNWLGALEALAAAPAPRVVVVPPGLVGRGGTTLPGDAARGGAGAATQRNDDDALVREVVEEARAFHAVEADVARRRAAALDEEARRRADDVGHATAVDASTRARVALAEHERALATIDDARARAALAAWTPVAADAILGALPAGGTRVDLLDDGWTRAAPDQRSAARRAFLGLPGGRDWA